MDAIFGSPKVTGKSTERLDAQRDKPAFFKRRIGLARRENRKRRKRHPRPKPNLITQSEGGSGFPGQEGDWDGDGRGKNLRTRFMGTSDALSPPLPNLLWG